MKNHGDADDTFHKHANSLFRMGPVGDLFIEYYHVTCIVPAMQEDLWGVTLAHSSTHSLRPLRPLRPPSTLNFLLFPLTSSPPQTSQNSLSISSQTSSTASSFEHGTPHILPSFPSHPPLIPPMVNNLPLPPPQLLALRANSIQPLPHACPINPQAPAELPQDLLIQLRLLGQFLSSDRLVFVLALI